MTATRVERALKSRVARRLGIAFILCAVVPLAVLAAVTTARTRAELDTQAAAALRTDLKSAEMDGLGRLSLLDARLEIARQFLVSNAGTAPGDPDALARLFPAETVTLTFVKGNGEARSLRGPVVVPALSARERAYLARNGRVLTLSPEPDGRASLTILLEGLAGSATLTATMAPAALFSLDSGIFLPAATDLCVFRATARIGCSSGAPLDVMTRANATVANGEGWTSGAEGEYQTATREMPLASLYGGEPWRLVMTRPRAAVDAALHRFTNDFWLVTLLAILVVAWVSLTQIRRQLRPLDALIAATARLSRREFSSPVALRSGDEFEELGEAYNALAAQLARQFGELEAFTFGTLDTLARAIDAKSSWTAGHSERVTAMAVAIAQAMNLPEDEILDLRRGGLVHDIGKLATPPEILDKPGALTPAEFEIMKQHTTKGVHILQPIAAFERLLPIVGQHHERWDGRGYPDGLKGAAIARTARVLAVADVWDAVRSDRPYRRGNPDVDVIGLIRANAGTHFDPDVVAAFLRVVESTGRPAGAPPVASTPAAVPDPRAAQPRLDDAA